MTDIHNEESIIEQEYQDRPLKRFCKKRTCILAIVLFLLIATFGLGPVDLSLYSLRSEGGYSAGFGSSLEKDCNIRVDFIRNGENVYTHNILTNGSSQVFMTVRIDKNTFEGNRYTPFYKDFTVHYKAVFDNNGRQMEGTSDSKVYLKQIPPSTRHVVSIPRSNILQVGSVNGNIEGEIHMRIFGLCSIKKAVSIADDASLKAIREYIVGQLVK